MSLKHQNWTFDLIKVFHYMSRTGQATDLSDPTSLNILDLSQISCVTWDQVSVLQENWSLGQECIFLLKQYEKCSPPTQDSKHIEKDFLSDPGYKFHVKDFLSPHCSWSFSPAFPVCGTPAHCNKYDLCQVWLVWNPILPVSEANNAGDGEVKVKLAGLTLRWLQLPLQVHHL